MLGITGLNVQIIINLVLYEFLLCYLLCVCTLEQYHIHYPTINTPTTRGYEMASDLWQKLISR